MQDYNVFKINEFNNSVLQEFNDLPEDKYTKIPKKYRQRRYSNGIIINNVFSWDRNKKNTFTQTNKYNQYLGNINRVYEEIKLGSKKYVQAYLIPKILKKLPQNNYKIGVHQIRVTTSDEYVGLPAPEGIHQDGFDYVFIMSVFQHNITGGNSLLFKSKKGDDIIFEKTLKNKQCLLINDRKIFHYASPIVPKTPGTGYRDVFVITYDACDLQNKFKV